jgi:hypothetical protein
MMIARTPTLAVVVMLMIPTGASTQEVAPKPPQGERATPTLNQTLDSDRAAAQRTIGELKIHIDSLLSDPIGLDIDRSLSDVALRFQHLEIDLAQFTISSATDPELRRLAARNIDASTERISITRDWQIHREILQQQITSPTTSTPTAKP